MTEALKALPGDAPVSGIHRLVGPLYLPRMHFPLEVHMPDGTPLGTLYTSFTDGTRIWQDPDGSELIIWRRESHGHVICAPLVLFHNGEPILTIATNMDGVCHMMAVRWLRADRITAYEQRATRSVPRPRRRMGIGQPDEDAKDEQPSAAEPVALPGELTEAQLEALPVDETVRADWKPRGPWDMLWDALF